MSQGWKIDGNDFLTYGVWVRKSAGVLDMPRMVDTSDNWLELDGKDYWQPVADTLYQDNEIVLSCFIESDSYANFKTAVANFYTALTAASQRVLTVPYLSSTIECFVEKEIKIKESNYIRTQQIGIFSLRLTVRNDSRYKQITIYKSDDTVRGVFNYDNKFKISKKLQGANNASFTIESNVILDIQRNDYVLLSHVTGVTDKYYLERDPEVKKSSTNKYIHQLRFEYEGYLINRVDFLILDDAETAYWGTAEDVIDRLIENTEIDYTGIFTKGTISSTININHAFSNQSCYQVLQQLASTYELEFDLKTVGGFIEISLKPQIGISTTPGLSYGKGNGLYSITRDSINNEQLITVLHAYGSSRNLPATYVNTRLKCTTFPLESNKTTFGAYSKTKNFDEIFPEYTGTVSGYVADLVDDGVDQRKYVVTDAAIPFNINDQLLPGIEAKIVFKTGDLAGYEFQIKRYDNTLKEIYLIEFNNNGDILPSPTLKPQIGDTYTLVDLDLPASYLTDAEVRLLAAATAYQAENDNPKVTYRATVSRGYQYDVVLNGYDIGDKVPITDTDFGLAAAEQRISDLTYNVFFGGYELILSEAPLITFRENIVQRLDEVEKTQDATNDQEVTEIRKRRTTGTDVINILTDPATLDFNHDDRTRRGTIDSRHQSYEAGTIDYSVERLNVECNLGGDFDNIRIHPGKVTIHNWRPSTLNRYDIRELTNGYASPENYDPIRSFTVAQTDISFPDGDGQFLYAKVPLDGVSTVGTIEHFKTIHRRVDYDPDYNYYKLGFISDNSSPRYAYMLWGNVKSAQPGEIGVETVNSISPTAGNVDVGLSNLTDYSTTNTVVAQNFRTQAANSSYTLITRVGGSSPLYVQNGNPSGDIARFLYGSTDVNQGTTVANIHYLGMDLNGTLSVSNNNIQDVASAILGTDAVNLNDLDGAISGSVNPTSGYLPYNNAGVFADSPAFTDGTNISINTTETTEVINAGGSETVKIGLRSTSNTGISGIHFGDPLDANSGRIQYEHDGDYMYFNTNNTEKLRVLTNGNLLINTTTDNGDKLQVNGDLSAVGGTFTDVVSVSNNNIQDVASAILGTDAVNLNDLDGAITGGTEDADFNSAVVTDEVYGVGWDSSLEVPTKNALYDKIETLGSPSFGTSTQVPYMNVNSDDFVYSDNFKFNGTTLTTNDIISGSYIDLDASNGRLTSFWLRLREVTAIPSASSGFATVAAKNDGLLYYRNDNNQTFELTNASGFSKSSDPSAITDGYIMWQSDGTGSGDNGDIMIRVNDGTTTKTATLIDFSAI